MQNSLDYGEMRQDGHYPEDRDYMAAHGTNCNKDDSLRPLHQSMTA